jgi:hypothetical protein
MQIGGTEDSIRETSSFYMDEWKNDPRFYRRTDGMNIFMSLCSEPFDLIND